MANSKAQGQTSGMVVFSHGQSYAALSRADEPAAVIVAAPAAFKDDDGNVYVQRRM